MIYLQLRNTEVRLKELLSICYEHLLSAGNVQGVHASNALRRLPTFANIVMQLTDIM